VTLLVAARLAGWLASFFVRFARWLAGWLAGWLLQVSVQQTRSVSLVREAKWVLRWCMCQRG